MNYPSVKTIMVGLRVSRAKALEIRGLMDGSIDPAEHPEKYRFTNQWIKACFHRPSGRELAIEAINEALDGFGVEALYDEGRELLGEYVNFGDTYVPTVVYLIDDKHRTPGYKIASWGDIAELYY